MTVYTPRRAARVLLVDADGRALLFAGFDPARPEHRYWFTPGGGLDSGESSAAGAARELAEETGLRLAPTELGEPVWRETVEFPFDGVWYRQEQEFFLVRVPSWEVDTSGFDAIEQASTTGHRWWSVAELAASPELYYPNDLPELLTRVLAAAEDPASGDGAPDGGILGGSGGAGESGAAC
ncbi:NUDIX domain-containing protein [Micromonospora sp. WMMD812]|uniref:NUDIX hydrolase n=1 Tax=Micromonospora sp. WMMD812 TaxID=3015152 RepID=UPI00248BD111|nr:NUDIX domain-containing protein [Micromonospora sp. WMMD812]WBB70430.1 NUDIX domain-containing protein [Micromonospora sp. WMMD812]